MDTRYSNDYEKILKNVFVADSYIRRLLGYMFRKSPHHEMILFQPCNSIHTFFMRFNIDVLFLDSDNKVIKKIERLSGNKAIFPVKHAVCVIESKEGGLANIEVGDYIHLSNK